MKWVLGKSENESEVVLTLFDKDGNKRCSVDVSDVISVTKFDALGETDNIATALGAFVTADNEARDNEARDAAARTLTQALDELDVECDEEKINSFKYLGKDDQLLQGDEFLQEVEQGKKVEEVEQGKKVEEVMKSLGSAIIYTGSLIEKYAKDKELVGKLEHMKGALETTKEEVGSLTTMQLDKLNELNKLYESIGTGLEKDDKLRWKAVVGGAVAAILVLAVCLLPVVLAAAPGLALVAAPVAAVTTHGLIDKSQKNNSFRDRIVAKADEVDKERSVVSKL